MNAKFLLFIAPALLYATESTVFYPGPNYTEVKQYLSLTDAQLQSLQSILDARNQAQNNIYNQISQKYQTLDQLMDAGTGTASQLGQILIDIQTLQKQLPLNDGSYKTQVQNVLTADQKAKLPKLSEVLQLQLTASEAGMLLLIDYPQYGGPTRIMAESGVAATVGAPTPGSSASSMLRPTTATMAPAQCAVLPSIR